MLSYPFIKKVGKDIAKLFKRKKKKKDEKTD